MPLIKLETPEVDQNITRMTVLDVVSQIKQITGIPVDAPVIYPDAADGIAQPGSTLGGGQKVLLSSSKSLQIEVEEDLEDEYFAPQLTHRPNEMPIFADNTLGIYIKPVYKQITFTVRFTYNTPNRSEAKAWRNKAQNMVSNTLMSPLHETSYHYFIHDKIWELLNHLYSLRESVAPYGQTWDQYVQEHITSRATMIAAQDGLARIGIRETQGRIQGEFEFQADPEKEEKQSDKNSWTIGFSYKFQMARPELLSMRYPIVVHNQLIEEKYIPMAQEDFEADKSRAGGVTSVLQHFEGQVIQQRMMAAFKIQKWPEYDDWTPDTPVPNTYMAASFLLSVSEDIASMKLANLQDLGDFELDKDVLEYIQKSERSWVTKLHCSPVQIALYRNECLQSWDTFEILDNLDVILKTPKDLRATYRLVICFSNDIRLVDYRSIKRLVKYPKAACKIFKATGTTQGRLNAFIQHIEAERFKDCVKPGGYTRQEVIDSIVWQKTVNNMYPEAFRREELEAKALKGLK